MTEGFGRVTGTFRKGLISHGGPLLPQASFVSIPGALPTHLPTPPAPGMARYCLRLHLRPEQQVAAACGQAEPVVMADTL